MFVALYIYVTSYLIHCISCVMEAKIVGGKVAEIEQFSHSAYLGIQCEKKPNTNLIGWICGSSILNQKIVLTAAHCLAECSHNSRVSVFVGDVDVKKGVKASATSYIIHENYYVDTTINDIGLVKVKTDLNFNEKIRRIILMEKPPYEENAQVAGWGIVNEELLSFGKSLTFIDQRVMEMEDCLKLLKSIPRGTFCASADSENKYATGGDSGSALVVRGNIQIGLVSYKKPKSSIHVIVYTDVGFFYRWIKENAARLFCDG